MGILISIRRGGGSGHYSRGELGALDCIFHKSGKDDIWGTEWGYGRDHRVHSDDLA